MKTVPLPKMRPLIDEEVKQSLSEIDFKWLFQNRETWLAEPAVDEEFVNAHVDWIRSGTKNKIMGLDALKHKTIIHGCSEALTDYHWAFRNHRLRLFTKEYAYNVMSADNFTFMDEDELREGDALIVSLPFSGFGDEHPEYRETMEICTKKNIPVLVDCCYYGMCQDIEFKLDYPCIEAACFSLSKAFASGNFRVGTLFSKNDAPSHLASLHKWGHTPQLAEKIALELMKDYGPDFIATKYRSTQVELCNEYGIDVTNTMILGLGDYPYKPDWPEKVARFDYKGKTIWRWGLRDVLKERYHANNPVSL